MAGKAQLAINRDGRVIYSAGEVDDKSTSSQMQILASCCQVPVQTIFVLSAFKYNLLLLVPLCVYSASNNGHRG
jgi:hypothetical protein